MWWSLVQSTQWEPLLGLLSPAFFDVVPAGMLISQLRGLTSHWLSRSACRSACAVPTLALCASMIIGEGSASWQIVVALLGALTIPLPTSTWYDIAGPDT